METEKLVVTERRALFMGNDEEGDDGLDEAANTDDAELAALETEFLSRTFVDEDPEMRAIIENN
jgi:hypothetical protein